jgi:predicted ester cyclase
MSTEANKRIAVEVLERAFNQGDLSVIDQYAAADGVDHQEPPGTDFRKHLKEVVTRMRIGFPDLHFEVHETISEGDVVAFRSTMTGTHSGSFDTGMGRIIPPSGLKISVPHMHFLRFVDGKNTDLWHVWDTTSMMRQMGAMPQPQPQVQPS